MDPQVESLTNAVSSLSLAREDEDCLPFGEPFFSRGCDDVPQFLFRVHQRESPTKLKGNTCIQPADAASDDEYVRARSRVDLTTLPVEQAALRVKKHLNDRYINEGHANLVSWTSSLLYALRYIFYRHHRNTKLEDMKLLVIDTSKFPEGVFVREAYFLQEYVELNQELNELRKSRMLREQEVLERLEKIWGWRNSPLYFGEYLSQGALNIANKACVVSVQKIRNSGLLNLYPGLNQGCKGDNSFLNWIVEERKSWKNKTKTTTPDERAPHVKKIAENFDPAFQRAVAAALLSLQQTDSSNLRDLRSVSCFPPVPNLTFKASSGGMCHLDKEMPEVRQFNDIMRQVANITLVKRTVLRIRRISFSSSSSAD